MPGFDYIKFNYKNVSKIDNRKISPLFLLQLKKSFKFRSCQFQGGNTAHHLSSKYKFYLFYSLPFDSEKVVKH